VKTLSLILVLIISVVLASSTGYLIYQENKYVAPTDKQVEAFAESIQYSSRFTQEPRLGREYFDSLSPAAKQVKMNAWIPSWAMNSGLKSLESKKEMFETVSPVYYEMASDGKLNVNKNGLEKLKSITQGTSIKIIPSVAGFEAGPLSTVLNDQEKYDRQIDFLIKEVDDNNFDGLDIDYEAIFLKDKEKFYSFMERLSTAMKSRGKMLTIAVLSKWGDFINYGFMPETRQVQDYAKLAEYVDQLRIMTYDYTSQGSTSAGPIAPISWMEDVLSYAVKRVPANKVVLGVHLYGYSWANGEAGRALDYGQIANLRNEGRVVDTLYSDISKESLLRYNRDGKAYYAYFASPQAVQERIELAARYGINGVAFWRLGDDPL
jgi:spore germination protein YaaH